MLAESIVRRLSVYRQLLAGVSEHNGQNVFSHELAALAGVTAAQVRRDLMMIGYAGSSRRGYLVSGLVETIGKYLDVPGGQSVVIVGLGNLGQAIIAYLTGRRRQLSIVAGFDSDPTRVNRIIHGCRCHPMSELTEIARSNGVRVAVLAVPGEAAQQVASQLVRAGVRGILNLAPARLQVPEYVCVEDLDIAVSLEKIAFFSRQHSSEKETLS